MKEFRVKWCQCPHNYNAPQVLFIEAGSAADAKAIAKDHVERKFGIGWFTVQEVMEIVKTVPEGRVK